MASSSNQADVKVSELENEVKILQMKLVEREEESESLEKSPGQTSTWSESITEDNKP
jgi:hypothetical protein